MKVIILCGGKGTRLGFETKIIPKPMVKIDNDPILYHIINYYMKFGYRDFIIALGYKGKIISKYLKKNFKYKKNLKCINTGLNTLTGTRLLKLYRYLKNENTYAYIWRWINKSKLIKLKSFHLKNKNSNNDSSKTSSKIWRS